MQRAFSLVELSIVLVILGLLTGGILAGQSLIRASELRSVSTDLHRYQTALHSFRDKYFALPGDISNATSFWGDQATGTGACADAAIADGTPGTCNGDGDGRITNYAPAESQRAWQHLAFAGLIEGSYPGVGTLATAGVMPSLRMKNGYINLYWSDNVGTAANGNANRYVVGALNMGGGTTSAALFKPEETWNIDAKIDDGIASRGRMVSLTGSPASSACTSGSEYNLSNNAVACYFTHLAR